MVKCCVDLQDVLIFNSGTAKGAFGGSYLRGIGRESREVTVERGTRIVYPIQNVSQDLFSSINNIA